MGAAGRRLEIRTAFRVSAGLLVLLGALAGAAAFARAYLQSGDALRDSLERAVRNELGDSRNLRRHDRRAERERLHDHDGQALCEAGQYELERVEVDVALAPLLRARVEASGIRAFGRATLAVAGASLEAGIDMRLSKRDRAGWRGELSGELVSGGSFQANADVDPTGWLKAAFEFEGLEMREVSALLQALPDPGGEFAGRFSGCVDVHVGLGTAGTRPATLGLRLQSPSARIRLQEISLEGPVRIQADLQGLRKEPVGSFEIDADGALVEYAGGMQRASGRSALVTGRIRTRAGRLAVDQLELSLTTFRAKVETAPASHRRSHER